MGALRFAIVTWISYLRELIRKPVVGAANVALEDNMRISPASSTSSLTMVPFVRYSESLSSREMRKYRD